MASGHANRANRPNTWLHRPATRREVLTCQPGAVHTWHLADIDADDAHVCFWGVKRTSRTLHQCPLMTQSGRRGSIVKVRTPTMFPKLVQTVENPSATPGLEDGRPSRN